MKKTLLTLLLFVLITACGSQAPNVPTALPTQTPFRLPEGSPTGTSPATVPEVPTVSATSSPYWKYTIEYLRSRPYQHPDDSGGLEITEAQGDFELFTRVLIRYPSDGLTITGYMNVPKGEGPFPVVIMLHGYAPPDEYISINEDYDLPTANLFASKGYLVIHPDLRGYSAVEGETPNFDNLFQTGLAIDTLNLIALVKETGGKPGSLATGDATRIGLWGHSLGGGVALRTITVSQDVRAAILYSAVSGDESKNSPLMFTLSGDEAQYEREQAVDPETLKLISPIYHFDGVTAAVKLYHGTEDTVVPVSWAVENCEAMKYHLPPEKLDCVYYIGGKHTVYSRYQPDFNNSQLAFFQTYLVP